MNLDLYHAQIGEGNLIELVREALPHVGEIQVADVPGRCEPGTGEINYRAVARRVQRRRHRPGVDLAGARFAAAGHVGPRDLAAVRPRLADEVEAGGAQALAPQRTGALGRGEAHLSSMAGGMCQRA